MAAYDVGPIRAKVAHLARSGLLFSFGLLAHFQPCDRCATPLTKQGPSGNATPGCRPRTAAEGLAGFYRLKSWLPFANIFILWFVLLLGNKAIKIFLINVDSPSYDYFSRIFTFLAIEVRLRQNPSSLLLPSWLATHCSCQRIYSYVPPSRLTWLCFINIEIYSNFLISVCTYSHIDWYVCIRHKSIDYIYHKRRMTF